MDSDLPLIEIAGEEDSLLDQIPDLEDTNTIPNVGSSYFACSPLQLSMIKPRLSNSKGFKARMDPAKPSCSSSPRSSNKENINLNKSEVPNLSVEPLQMKKRKKSGGYNLRKSLAWDRAFDTDEGVLDPLELSMITGTFSRSCTEILPIISEEGSEDLQAVEGTAFTEMPDKNSTIKVEKKGSCLVPKHNSLAKDNIYTTPNATKKVFSTYGGAKPGSKGGGCPKPLAASSLKRPASASTVRVIRKDSKLPKLPNSKTGPHVLSTHTRSTTECSSHLKHNQIAKQAVNIQKTVTEKCSSTNVKCAQTKAKTGSGVSTSRGKDSARSLTISLLEAQSSTNSRMLQVNRVISGSEVMPQPEVPSTRFRAREDQMSSASPTIPLKANPSITNDKVVNPKIQSMKPSGLRMPSPSIGFFGQSKASVSETLSQRSVGPCGTNLGTNIHGTHKLGMSRLPPVPGNVHLIASSSINNQSSSSALCAVPDNAEKFDLGELNVQNMPTDAQSDSKSYESLFWKQNGKDNIEANQEVFEPVDCIQLKEAMLKQDLNLQTNNIQVTPNGGSNKQYEGDYGTELKNLDDVPFPCEDRKQENGGASGVYDFPDQSLEGNAHLALNKNPVCEKCNSDSFSEIEKNKCIEACDISNQKSFKSQSHREQEKGGSIVVADVYNVSPSGHAPEIIPHGNISSNNCNSDQGTAMECTKSLEICELDDQRTIFFESICHREQGYGGVDGVDYVSNKSHVEQAQRTPSTSRYHGVCVEVCDSSDTFAKKLGMENVCFASEPTCQFSNEGQSDDSMLLVENSCSKEPQCKEAIDIVQFIFPGGNDFTVRGSNAPPALNAEVPGKLNNDGVDDRVTERATMEQPHVCSLEVLPLPETHEHSSHMNSVFEISSAGDAMPLGYSNFLRNESGLHVQTIQASSDGSNLSCTVVDQLSHNVVVEQAEIQIHEEDSYNRQRREASSVSSFQKIKAVEDFQAYLGDAGDYQCSDDTIGTLHCQIQTADQADNDVGGVDTIPESHLDAQAPLFEGDELVGSRNNDSPISHEQSTMFSSPLEVFGEHPELLEGSLKVQQLLEENQDNVLASESEIQMHEGDSYNRQKKESSCGRSFQKITAEGCNNIMKTSPCQIQSSDQADKDVGGVDNISESHLNVQFQLFNGDELVESCSNDTPISPEQPTEIACPLQVFGEHPELPESHKVQQALLDNLGNLILEYEAEDQTHERDSYNRQTIEASGGSFQKTATIEETEFYLGDGGDGQSCSNIMETFHCQTQTADQAEKEVGRVDNIPESYLDSQFQVFNGDELIGSCSNDMQILHEQFPKIACPLEVFGEQPESHDSSLKVKVLVDNEDNLLLDFEGTCKESILENVEDISVDAYGCDLGTLSVISKDAMAELESCHDFAEDQPTLDCAPSGSPVVDSTDCNEISIDRWIIRSMESSGQAVSSADSNLEVSNKHSTSLRATFGEASSIHEIPLSTGTFNKMFGDQSEVSNSCREVEIRTEYHQAVLKDDLCPTKIIDSKELQHDNAVESLPDVLEGNFISEKDQSSSNVVVHVPVAAEGKELSDDDQCSAENYDVYGPPAALRSSAEKYDYIPFGQLIHGTEISNQAASRVDPDLNTSTDQIASLETASNFCLLHEESCPLFGEDTHLSKNSSQSSTGKSHRELDAARDLENDMDATLSTRRSENKLKLDIPLIRPPPNAVPFSDEWLAAVEAAGEDILTLKSGAVQNSPPDKSLPEPSPWSPVKRKNNQLGPFDCTKKLGNTMPGDPNSVANNYVDTRNDASRIVLNPT